MLTGQEKSFLDAVAKCYCSPVEAYGLLRTMTALDAAYYAAKEQGVKVPPGEIEREAFFTTFMGGLMHKAEGKAYLSEAVELVREGRKQQLEKRVAHRISVAEAAQEQMDIILAAAQKIQRLTSSIRLEYQLFRRHSAEMDMLSDVKRRIAAIKNSAASDEDRDLHQC